jgi:hypothetical protein
MNDRLWWRVLVRTCAVLLVLAGMYFIWGSYWMIFEWAPTFAEFDGEPVPSKVESWTAFLPYAAVGAGAVALGAWVFSVTRKPQRS